MEPQELLSIARKCLAVSGDLRGLDKPAVGIGGSIFCNGHVAVQLFGVHVEDAVDNQERNVEDIIAKAFATAGEFIPVPNLPTGPKLCPICIGYGRTRKCPDCNGEGVFLYGESNLEYDCKNCDCAGDIAADRGEGDFDCRDCNGIGQDLGWNKGMDVGPGHFSVGYVRLLSLFHGVSIAPVDDIKAAPFRFDGGHGVLMPRRR